VPAVFPGRRLFVARRNVFAQSRRKGRIGAKFDGISLCNAATFQMEQLNRKSP
jgi:hypothetical protein